MRRRLWIVCFLLVLTVSLGQTSVGADEKTDELITKLEAKANTVNSYRADLTMTMEMMGQKMVHSGKMAFKKPNKNWMELNTKMGNTEMKQIVISDGKTTWMYSPTMNMVQKMDLEKIIVETGNDPTEQRGGDISKPLQGFKRESLSYVRTENMDGEEVYVFQGNPKSPEMDNVPFAPAKMEIWLGADNGMPRKMVMLTKEGKEMMSQEYSNINVNVDIPDSQFEFTPPEGIQVTDITEGTINMMKQMKKGGE